VKYGWIAVVAMMAALLSTGQVAAQEWGAQAAPETPTPQAEAAAEEVEAEAAAQLAEDEAPKVTGFRPPGQSDEAGMGTQAAERERARRSIGTVGESVRGSGKTEEAIPLKFHFHGYYRARYNWIGNAPMSPATNPNQAPAGERTDFWSKNASYGTMRLRIDPEVTYGPNPDLPIARLRFTVDGFDNVVWGDNARVFGVPLFAVDQSFTDINGTDLRESLKLERAWIEFLVPIGQMRVGRMESHWGMGQLTHAGNGLAEWGDFYRGETFDRILFATRPITLARGISKGDTRSTPLIYAFVYDRLTQDPVVPSIIPSAFDGSGGAATNPNFKPTYTTFPERSTFPQAYLTNLDRRVSEIVNVLAWFDEDFGNGAQDELFAGAYTVYRWQRSTQSRIIIPDVSWRMKYTLKDNRKLALYTEGEWHSIFGHSGALRFTEGCGLENCNRGRASIHNIMARAGIGGPGKWGAYLEGGWSSGDDDILSIAEGTTPGSKTPTLSSRAFNTNVKVGLLLYQVALKALSWNALTPLGAGELGANGSVWNSVYLLPVGRVTIVPGLEFHAQFLVAWASRLDPLIYGPGNKQTDCKFKSDCFYGWEADLALRAKMGAKDIIWVDLEGGLMQPGKAFTNAGFNDALLWTTQLRAAMIF
jgi:hypothetical protein